MDNDKKMKFIFEKNKDNQFVFKEIKYDESSFGENINVSLDLLKDIIKKKSNLLSKYSDEASQFICFDVSDALSSLVEQYKKENSSKTEEELYHQIEDELTKIFKSINCIKENNSNGMVSYTIDYNKDKQASINETTERNSVQYADYITEIDMSKVNPDEVVQKIKEKVIAQDKAVETILYNIYNNQKILESGNDDLLSAKANIILDGPTGTGKTFILKEVAKNLTVPINITPADMYAAPGYKGAQLEEMLISLLDQTNGNVELAERGIIVLDEFDKLCVKGENSLEMHKAIQHSLLTYIGGTKVSFEYKGKTVEFDTSKLTFICLGAFTDLRERKIKTELDENDQYTIKPEDYIQEGMQRELVGRFTLVTATQSLGKEDMKRILTESKTSPLLNLQEIGRMYGKEIIFDDGVIDRIAEEAVAANTGARALQTIVNGIYNLIIKEVSNSNTTKEFVITSDYIDRSNEVYKRSVVK